MRNFFQVAEALQGRNVIVMSEKEENYKAISAAAGLAPQPDRWCCRSADDINLAKQLNVVTAQLGVDEKIVMNVGTAALVTVMSTLFPLWTVSKCSFIPE